MSKLIILAGKYVDSCGPHPPRRPGADGRGHRTRPPGHGITPSRPGITPGPYLTCLHDRYAEPGVGQASTPPGNISCTSALITLGEKSLRLPEHLELLLTDEPVLDEIGRAHV